jgi:hypothetical protein
VTRKAAALHTNSPAEFHQKSIKSPFYPNGQCCLLSITFERESAEFQTPWFHLPRRILFQ